jgi:3-phosphoshikimate 1-carboxyvinyltransferase
MLETDAKNIRGKTPIQGSIRLAGDKSISHRVLVMAFISGKPLKIHNLNRGQDCLHTLSCLQELGLKANWDEALELIGAASPWTDQSHILYAGNSGTTVRLLMGLAAGLKGGAFTILGDESLSQRPMARVALYLEPLGVKTLFPAGDGLPLTLTRAEAQPPHFMQLQIPSAQLKSAVLLAALGGSQPLILRQQLTRNHSELMLREFGADISWRGEEVTLRPGKALNLPESYTVAGDISTGAFFAGAAAIDGQVTLQNCGINPTRRAVLDVLAAMGSQVRYANRRILHGEEVGAVEVTAGSLRAVDIGPELIPFLIDELPLLAAVALFAQGTTRVAGAGELKHKESDRLKAIARLVQAFGGKIQLTSDGFVIHGGQKLYPGEFSSKDHRLVMAAAVAALFLPGLSRLAHWQAPEISAPGFWQLLAGVCPGAGI